MGENVPRSMCPSKVHERILQEGMAALRAKGFRVIRLDRRKVPDAIAIKGNEVIAVEAETNPTALWFTRRKQENSEFDDAVAITPPYKDVFYRKEEYDLALQLRRIGMTYKQVRDELEKKFRRKPALGTLHAWFEGEKRPLGI